MNTWMIILVRSIGLFFLTLILVKLLGRKRQGKMTPFNFINYTIIAMISFFSIFKFNIKLGIWNYCFSSVDFYSYSSRLSVNEK